MRIEFEGTANQVREEMRALMGLDRDAPSQPSTSETTAQKPPAARGKGKPASAEGNSGGDATSSTAGSSAAGDPAGDAISRDDVAKLATTFGNPTKGGPSALKELFIEMGAPNGKWSEITDDKLPALKARLDELLA